MLILLSHCAASARSCATLANSLSALVIVTVRKETKRILSVTVEGEGKNFVVGKQVDTFTMRNATINKRFTNLS